MTGRPEDGADLSAYVDQLEAERDALKAELEDGAASRALDDIWASLGESGTWEYPGQVVRAVRSRLRKEDV